MNKMIPYLGKHIIPRNLYHITSNTALEKIKTDGWLRPYISNDEFRPEAIFLFELQNVLKKWQQLPGRQGKSSLLCNLLEKTEDSNIVILKIPTKNLNPNQMLVRSQDWYFYTDNKLPNSQLEKVNKFLKELYDMGYSYSERMYEKYFFVTKIIDKLFPGKSDHIRRGYSVKEAPLYKQRGEAIEYIYTYNKIPLSEVEIVGSANRQDFYNNGNTLRIKDLLLELFKGRKEQIAVEKVLK